MVGRQNPAGHSKHFLDLRPGERPKAEQKK